MFSSSKHAKRGSVAVGIVAVITMVGACSSGDTSQSGSGADPAASATPAPAEVIEGYFTAMTAGQPEQMLTKSAPDSPAYDFGEYWITGADAGSHAERRLVSTSDTDAVVARADNGEEATYRDFVFNAQTGLLETWTEEPGGPLAPRIVNTPKTANVSPITVTIKQQYVAADQDIVITMVATNKNNKGVSLTAKSYVAPDGRSVSVSNSGTIPKRSTAAVTLVAKRGKLAGGRLTLYTFPEGGGASNKSTTIKLPTS